jgi:hypothetical protein
MEHFIFITLIIACIITAFLLFATQNNWLYLRIFCYEEYKEYKFALKNINECKYDFSINETDHFLLYNNYSLTLYHSTKCVGIFKKVNNNWDCVFSSFFKTEAKELYNKLLEIKQKEFTKDVCVKIPEKIYFLQCEEDKGRGFWLFKANDNNEYLTGTSTSMYFMYNRSQRFNELNNEPVDNSNVINKLDLVYKNNNNGIIMDDDNILTMRPATADEIELFKCSELLECE